MDKAAQIEKISVALQEKLAEVYLEKHGEKEWLDWCRKNYKRNRIPYACLPDLLERCGITAGEMFQLVDVTLCYPNDGFQQVAELCAALPEETVARMYSVLLKCTPDVLLQFQEPSPTKRILDLYRRRHQTRNIRLNSPEYMQKSMRAAVNISIRTEDMVQASQDVGASLHWILAFDENTMVYGPTPKVDQVLDVFSFASPEVRRAFVAALQEKVAESREGEGA